jgi:drug/metabolite transporter (DMT)-like permease
VISGSAGGEAPPANLRGASGRIAPATAALTAAAMVAFAANSLLARAALRGAAADPIAYTVVRLASGAAALLLLARGRPRSGTWRSALALALYAFAFSIAYLRIGAGVGALLLFAAVQITMIAWGIWRGERPSVREWTGLVLASGGLVGLTLPGATAPDPIGVVLMLLAGVGWGIYTLRGKSATRPLAANAGNFLRTVPIAGVLLALAAARALGGALPTPHLSSLGWTLALASGALASGAGYAVWYAALRGLTATRAAVVQLSVVPLAAAGASLLLGEPVTLRLALFGAIVLAGIALALTETRR